MKKRLLFKIVTGYLAIVLLTVSVMGYLTAYHLKSGLTERIEGELIFQTILIVLIPSMLIALVFFFRLVTPIREIEEYTRKVRENDKGAMLMIDSDDEIGSLSRNINYMVQFQQEKINLLREEKSKLEATFASMMEGVMVLNAEHKIEVFNNSMLNMIGTGFPDIIGKTPIEVLRNVSLQDALSRVLATGEPATGEIGVGEDNQVILEVSISAINGQPGDERKIMMVFHDVTRLRKLERIRADFVANATHELKTPLTAIIGFVETLQEADMNEKKTAEQFLKKIGENAYRLNRLVNDLLILSKLEAGGTKLELRNIQIGDVLKEVLPVIEGASGAKGIIIHHEIPSDLPPISADREKVIQVFLNVLDNAVKFTDSGKISITASVVNKGCVTVNIADTGIGIPYSDLPRLGERFYRVDKTRSRELGGTGLGLSIVKHLMNAQGGRMRIESTFGRGTTVSLDFPISN